MELELEKALRTLRKIYEEKFEESPKFLILSPIVFELVTGHNPDELEEDWKFTFEGIECALEFCDLGSVGFRFSDE